MTLSDGLAPRLWDSVRAILPKLLSTTADVTETIVKEEEKPQKKVGFCPLQHDSFVLYNMVLLSFVT